MKGYGRQRSTKSLKTKGKGALPSHVKESENQLTKMKSMIQDLLGPFVDRFHIFELPHSPKKTKRKS